jgi:hypothetical protein
MNFDHNSNLVRKFHTMEKIVKMCQFYSDGSRFFLQPTVFILKKSDCTFFIKVPLTCSNIT